MKLSGCTCCSVQLLRKPGLNVNLLQKPQLSMKLSRKPELSMQLSRKSELSISCRESLYMYIIAFGYKKNNPARRAGEKNNLAPKLSEKKISWPGKKFQAPPPPNIKWTVPNHTILSGCCQINWPLYSRKFRWRLCVLCFYWIFSWFRYLCLFVSWTCLS